MKVNNAPGSRTENVAPSKSGTTGRAKNNAPSANKESGEALGGSARVAMSPRAREAQRAREVAASVPDVDEAKVAKYQKLIDSGQYKVDARAVAERLVDEHLNTGGISDE